jgi:uncharacterized protein (DUF58 family)
MSQAGLLVPQSVEGRAQPSRALGIAFGSRFFVLLVVGLAWIGPALVDIRFAYAMAVWDLLLVAAWLLDAARLPAPHEVAVRRAWLQPVSISVGSPVRLTLVNGSGSPILTRLLDAVPRQLRAVPPDVELNVRAHSEARTEYHIVPGERGRIELGDVYLRYQSPFRIAERWAKVALRQPVVVYPNLDEARRETEYLVRSRQIAMERRSRRVRGAGRSFESLREYQDGDELRDICWTASARRGKLVTRLYEVERSQTIWIAIDAGRLMRARVADITKLDRAVNAALALAQVALTHGDRVGLIAYGRRIGHYLPAAPGRSHLRAIIEQLAMVRADEADGDHLQAVGRLLTDEKRRSLVVWMTDLPDTAMTPEVVQAASRLMPAHLVLFAVVGQPDLERVAHRLPKTVEEMYETAAAEEVTHRRELLIARLRARGALALEVSTTLSPAIVNAYLDVKQQGRL